MYMNVDDLARLAYYDNIELELEAAWNAALKLFCCVECARLDLVQRLRLMARGKLEIVRPQPDDENVLVPVMGPDGVFRYCNACQSESEPRAVRFFEHGTDELS